MSSAKLHPWVLNPPSIAQVEEFMRYHGYARAHFSSRNGGSTYNIELAPAESSDARMQPRNDLGTEPEEPK